MKKLLLLLLLLPVLASAQKISINGKDGYRLLTWDDFKGKVNKESPFTATTFWSLHWQVAPFNPHADTLMAGPELEVRFTDDSWLNKKKEHSPALLRHEQGHFDIAVICGAELQKRYADTLIPAKAYRATVHRMYQEAMTKCRQMQNQYDKETNHSKNAADQVKWNEYIATELARFQHLSSAVN